MRTIRLPGYNDRREAYLAASPAPGPAPCADMVWIPGGRYLAGAEGIYPEEAPMRERQVRGFWMDRTPVTNAAFGAFIKATGYVTQAEMAWQSAEGKLPPHGLVFRQPKTEGPLDDPRRWWRIVEGADWRRPRGPGAARPQRWSHHPVVQVSLADARRYAEWAGKTLPNEAQWEFAARGGLDGALFAWGNEDRSDGVAPLANRWRGRFPVQHITGQRFRYTSPVDTFPPNGFGLRDMTGNVWEWTESTEEGGDGQQARCCSAATGNNRHVLKGGSHLCAPNYCFRYRPAARMFHAADLTTSHIGFRCIFEVP